MSLRRLGHDPSPRSVAEITEEAGNFEFYVERPLKSWLQSARVLQNQATSCENQGDLQLAYLYAYRHAILVLEKLQQYPAGERAKHKDELSRATRQVNKNFVKLEAWKPQLQEAHELAIKASKTYTDAVSRRAQQRPDEYEIGETSPGHSYTFDHEQRRSIDAAAENSQSAVGLSRQELQRKTHPSSLPEPRSTLPQDDLARQIQDTRQLLDRKAQSSLGKGTTNRTTLQFHYPDVPHRGSEVDRVASQPVTSIVRSSLPPLLPSKIIEDREQPSNTPPRPRKEAATSPAIRSKITSYTEGGVSLRSVLLPSTLHQSFLNLAHSNTTRNLETCGVLCASLVSNTLIITHLVIPDQTSTSDTCDATDSGDTALFDYCDEQNLLVCGWIHTHPTQSCFLSSRDLHTSSGYQQMLPEAIAIVCAPRHNPSLGVFRLTSPPGLPAVLRCQKPGLFHTHEEQNLYTDASTPGHVVEDPNLDFRVVDLRAG